MDVVTAVVIFTIGVTSIIGSLVVVVVTTKVGYLKVVHVVTLDQE